MFFFLSSSLNLMLSIDLWLLCKHGQSFSLLPKERKISCPQDNIFLYSCQKFPLSPNFCGLLPSFAKIMQFLHSETRSTHILYLEVLPLFWILLYRVNKLNSPCFIDVPSAWLFMALIFVLHLCDKHTCCITRCQSTFNYAC